MWQKVFRESNNVSKSNCEDRQEEIECYSYLTAICTQLLLLLGIQVAPGLYFAKRRMKKITTKYLGRNAALWKYPWFCYSNELWMNK